MAELIEIQNNADERQWNPFVGEETNELLKSKGFANADGTLDETGERILDETYRIMEICGNPNNSDNHETGLVIGYVQSGKTLSFTTLTALARDNNYQIIIIIAGTSIPLSNQSYERMKKDLKLDDRFDRKWIVIKNPKTQEDGNTIEMKLEQWADTISDKNNCSTILLTVMKNGNHLKNLTRLLKQLNIRNVPTLIVDDESDQASLNTKESANAGANNPINEGQASTIYRRINDLRSVFPHHTFLQYTATPQAILFTNIMNRLSPNFIKLLTPGDDYTGGKTFFIENPNLIREIPVAQVPTNQNPIHEPPESLLYALKFFFLGVAAGEILKDQRNRSMMVHPSRLTNAQNVFFNWIRSICDSWKRLLESNEDEEKSALLNEFQIAYNDLLASVGSDLPSFQELSNRLIQTINYTRIMEVNASRGKTPPIRWSDFYSHILVGGQSMDRGFTVEGLTVTYMPRNLGTSQVDTTLQRARFFGYKKSYLGYCRVWLEAPTIQAYLSIIEHEEDVRQRLEDFDVNNRHLNNWDREVVLDSVLKLTRPNVLYDAVIRDRFGSNWIEIKSPHDTDNLIETNKNALFEFLNPKAVLFGEDAGHPNRTEDQKHLVAQISLQDCLDNLLKKLKFTRESDSATYSSLRGVFNRYLENHPNENCLVYLMSANSLDDWKIRTRRLKSRLDKKEPTEIQEFEIQELFQGKNPRTGEVIYPGDREIKNNNLVSIQIHRLHLKDGEGNDIFDEDGNLKYVDVPTLAIWIPEHIGVDIIRQV